MLKKEKFINNLITKDNISFMFNHLLIIYSFFLTLDRDIRKSTFFVLIILFIIHPNFKKNILKAIKNPVIKSMLFLYILLIIGSINVENFSYAKEHLIRMKPLLYPIILYPLVQYKFIPRIITAFIFGMLINEMTSYGLFLKIVPETWSYANSYASTSPFSTNTVAYPYLLSITLGILFYKFLNNEFSYYWQKIILFIFLMLSTLNIFFNISRTGYILYFIIMFIVLLYTFKKNILKLFSAALIIFIVIFSLAFSFLPSVQYKVKETSIAIEKMSNNNFNSSLGYRIALWKLGYELFKSKPILGYGTGQDMLEAKKISIKKYPELTHIVVDLGKNIHNIYIQILVQIGLVGLIALFTIFFQMISYKQDDPNLKIILLILVSASMTYGMSSIWFHNIPAALFVSIGSFALVKKTAKEDILNKVTKYEIINYIVISILLFTISKYS